MASHETPGLRNLRTSARLAGLGPGPGEGSGIGHGMGRGPGQGVGETGSSSDGSGALGGHTFTVVGLGKPYSDYTDKIVALHAHLHATHKQTDPATAFDPTSSSSSSSTPAYLHPDDDVVVVVDAYDILLLPAVRMAPAFLASSSAPLVFCAENGGYPEFAFASLYQVLTSLMLAGFMHFSLSSLLFIIISQPFPFLCPPPLPPPFLCVALLARGSSSRGIPATIRPRTT